MKSYIIILLLFLFCQSIFAQKPCTPINDNISPNEILPVIVFQQDSPIKIDNFFVTKDACKLIKTDYQVSNISDKSVASYQIARWYSDNTGYIGEGIMPESGNALNPKQSIKTYSGNSEETKYSGSNSKELKLIIFIMVTEVTFSDGSKYEAKDVFLKLRKHLLMFETIYDKMR
jgi:hypothetical protein